MVTRGLLLQGVPGSEAWDRAIELLEQVGLGEASMKRKPISFSGGQRQRIGIARALSLQPDVVVADEMQENFGGIKSFDWAIQDNSGATSTAPGFQTLKTTKVKK